jgi:hypothetical protein
VREGHGVTEGCEVCVCGGCVWWEGGGEGGCTAQLVEGIVPSQEVKHLGLQTRVPLGIPSPPTPTPINQSITPTPTPTTPSITTHTRPRSPRAHTGQRARGRWTVRTCATAASTTEEAGRPAQ